MTNILLITGFLGAGKTTLLRNIISHSATTAHRTALIVNEFGQLGIDGEILSDDNLNTIELTDGCLCCTLQGALEDAVNQLLQNANIDRIVIEASGAAAPQETVQLLQRLSEGADIKLCPVVCVIDASRHGELDRYFGEFLDLQIQDARVVILNKTDIASPQQISIARAKVKRLNEAAEIIEAIESNIDIASLFKSSVPTFSNVKESKHNHNILHSFVIRDFYATSMEDVLSRFSSSPSSLVRAKGFIKIDEQFYCLHYAGNAPSLVKSQKPRKLGLVFIGLRSDAKTIERHFSVLGSPAPSTLKLGRFALPLNA